MQWRDTDMVREIRRAEMLTANLLFYWLGCEVDRNRVVYFWLSDLKKKKKSMHLKLSSKHSRLICSCVWTKINVWQQNCTLRVWPTPNISLIRWHPEIVLFLPPRNANRSQGDCDCESEASSDNGQPFTHQCEIYMPSHFCQYSVSSVFSPTGTRQYKLFSLIQGDSQR